jgi:predicted extracellular nuclease
VPRVISRLLTSLTVCAMALGLAGLRPPAAAAASSSVVISQVYGGGGNATAIYQSDFIELANLGTSGVNVTGWSVQYASSTGSTWSKTALAGQIGAGQHFLIQESTGNSCSGSPCGVPLPGAQVTGSLLMAGGAGKVALVNTTTTIVGGTVCPTGATVVDLVGYGTGTNCFEGTGPTGTLSATTAAMRADGAADSDNNAADFTVGAPNPRNAGGLSLSINDVSHVEPSGSMLYDFTIQLSLPAPAGGVTFDVATADDTATAASNDYVADSLTGESIPEGQQSYMYSVAVNGDNTFEPDETFFVNVANVTGAAVADGQGVGTIVNNDPPPSCGDTTVAIHDIQGSGASAAVTGFVTTQGVVTGDFETSAGISGFYIQDPAADADPDTSEGILVYTGPVTNAVNVGDFVLVSGYARERFAQTAIQGAANDNNAGVPASNITLCSTGNPLPAPTEVLLPVASIGDFEKYEGMYVEFTQNLVISEYFNYDQFGEIVLALPLAGETRAFSGTAIDAPGAAANARTLANSLSRITLDDANNNSNPPVLRHPDGLPFSNTNDFRGGDHVQNAIGVLGYDFNLYRIYPTGPADFTKSNPRPAAPASTGGRLTVAAQNTLNFFLTPDYPSGDPRDNACGPANNVECRGWDFDQPTELTRQRDKLLATLEGLNADIIGLNEIENSTGVDPLGDPTNGIVAGLNDYFGAGTYSSIDAGTIGTDAIKVGIVYRPGKVTPVGAYKLLTSSVDSRFIDTKSRPVLAQTFVENATGERFTVAVNHLKSKGSACTDIGDADTGDGQGNCNLTRTAAAKALVDWLATDPTGSSDSDFLIIGDLNSYAMEDPITAIKAGPDDTLGTADDYTNLVNAYLGQYAYSYTFDGQAGYLDHALSSPTMTGQVSGVAEWHINSDEADVFDYDTSFKPPEQEALYEPRAYRSSDHDGVIVGLNLHGLPTKVTINAGDDQSTAVSTSFGTQLDVTVTDSAGDPVANTEVTFAGPTSGASASIVETGPYRTDADGNLVVTAQANGAVGGPYELVATAGDATATFHLTNTVGAAATITINAGDNQQTAVGTDFPTKLDLTVLDAGGNPVPNATLTFAGPASGASASIVEAGPYTTDSNGNLLVTVHANGTDGGPYDFVATSGGASSTFHLSNLPAANAAQLSTGATCATFNAGTAASLTEIGYSVKKAKINSIAAGTFSYWVNVTATQGANTFTVNQAVTSGNFATLFAAGSGSSVYRSDCSSVSKASFTQSTTAASSGTITVKLTAPVAGTYSINVKFSTNELKNAAAPSPATVAFTFSTTGVAGSAKALDLVGG